jgi:hypothetical protein
MIQTPFPLGKMASQNAKAEVKERLSKVWALDTGIFSQRETVVRLL